MVALFNNNKWEKISQEKVAEIRNCLAVILGSAELLQRDVNLLSDQKEKLQRIVDQTHRIAKLLS